MNEEAAAPMLEVTDLAKSFGPTQALQSCSFDVAAGEIHAIIGENGSGKSTLVKILAGIHRPDRGSIRLNNRTVHAMRSPRAANAAGIVAVFQEVLSIGPRSVIDNISIGSDRLLVGGRAAKTRSDEASKLLSDLLGATAPSLTTPVEELSLSDRQVCCIVRALVRHPRILILDEATSALDVAVRSRLFAILKARVASGGGAIFISHRMDEIEEIGDRITVMRSGRSVATLDRSTATAAVLFRLMTGDDQLTSAAGKKRLPQVSAETVLTAKGIRLRPAKKPFDFSLQAGDLVGVGGLEGNGQEAFLDILRGLPIATGAVELTHDGKLTPLRSPRRAARRGIAYVPRERRAEALFPSRSIRDNFSLPTLRADAVLGFVSNRRSERRWQSYVKLLHVRLGRSGDLITTLSGGNQQKVILARWLAANPRILLLNDPTRGVDIGVKRDIYELLVEFTRSGVAVVMVSTELEELIELMDRVLVFRDFELSATLEHGQFSREELLSAFFGHGTSSVA